MHRSFTSLLRRLPFALILLMSLAYGCFEGFDRFERDYPCMATDECSNGFVCMNADAVSELSGQCDFDCSDNPKTKYILNFLSHKSKKILISGFFSLSILFKIKIMIL